MGLDLEPLNVVGTDIKYPNKFHFTEKELSVVGKRLEKLTDGQFRFKF